MRAAPATVQAPSTTSTAYGGLVTAWTSVATVWVALTRADPVDAAAGPDAQPAPLEKARAGARAHPALAAGVRLDTGDGAPWSVTEVRAGEPAPGRCLLLLERLP